MHQMTHPLRVELARQVAGVLMAPTSWAVRAGLEALRVHSSCSSPSLAGAQGLRSPISEAARAYPLALEVQVALQECHAINLALLAHQLEHTQAQLGVPFEEEERDVREAQAELAEAQELEQQTRSVNSGTKQSIHEYQLQRVRHTQEEQVWQSELQERHVCMHPTDPTIALQLRDCCASLSW